MGLRAEQSTNRGKETERLKERESFNIELRMEKLELYQPVQCTVQRKQL